MGNARALRAENGAQALAKLHAGAQSGALYTVALLDRHLPDMDGLQLARAIKADPAIASVRLLMLTSTAPMRMLTIHSAPALRLASANRFAKPICIMR
jgi:CheY-like chemotaxis protein